MLVVVPSPLRSYECDAYLQNDNKRGDLEALRVMVEQLQTHTISESRTRSGRLLKSSSHVKLHPREYWPSLLAEPRTLDLMVMSPVIPPMTAFRLL